MNRIEQIKLEQKKLADELESEMLKERANVLARMKEDIKLFGPNLITHLRQYKTRLIRQKTGI